MSESAEGPQEGIPAHSDLTCSFERSVKAVDTTLKQLATTKETFSNFEAFYKKFVVELNEVREEHHLELYQCQTKIDDLLKDKTVIEEQLCNSRKKAKKYKEEFAAAKRKQAETEWENEKQAREISSLKVINERLGTEKDNLELEVTSLRKKLGNAEQEAPAVIKEGEKSMLDVAKQEIEELESRYKIAMEEKEALHVDIVTLQKHMGELQMEYKNTEKELQTKALNANVQAYKAEMKLKNMTRQKETLIHQFEECQKELKKTKDRCLALERQKSESQEMAEICKDEINVKVKQIETLNDLNQTLENKMNVMIKELCTPEVSNELLASPDETLIQDLELSESKIQDLEKSLQSIKNEKQDIERDVIMSRNKITGLEESNQRSQEEIRELEQHLTVARNNASALETELFKQTSRCSNLQGELNQFREQEHFLKSQLIDANQHNTEMERKLEQVLEENDEVKQNASLADRKLADLIELVMRTENSNNQLEDKLSTLKNQVSKVEGRNESNTKQVAKLKMEVEAEREKRENVEKELLVVNSRLNAAQRITERANREKDIKERFSGELKKANKTNEEKLQHLNEKLGKLEAKLELAEEEKRDLHQETLDSQHRIKELEADNNLCVQEKDRLDLDIQQLCKKINDLQSNLNVCEHEKHEFEHQAALLQQKVKKYEAELSEIMKNNADLEAKIREAISSTCQSNDEVAGLRRQIEEYKRVADEIGKEVVKKDKQLEKLREKIMAGNAYSESVQDELTHAKMLLETRDKEKKELEKQLVLINDEVNRVKDVENITTKRKVQLEEEVEMLREKLQCVQRDKGKSLEVTLMNELDYERAKANHNQKELDSLQSKIDSLETENDVSKKDFHVVTENLQVAEETILNLSSNLERSLEEKNEETRRFYVLENRLRDVEKDLHLSQTMREEAEEEVCASKEKIAQLESKVDALDKNRNLIKDQLDTANDNLMNQREEIMRLKSKIPEQDKTSEYLNHVITEKDHVIQESRDRVRTCEADLDEVRKRIRKYQVSTEGLKAENMEYEKIHLMYQENIRKMEKDLFKQCEMNNTLNQQIFTQTLHSNNLQGKISSLRKKKDHYKSEHENAQESIRRAKQQLLNANNRIRENEISAETNLMKLREKENSITTLRESKIALETELICAKTDLETLRRYFEQSKEKVKELEQSLEEVGVNASLPLDRMMSTVDTETEGDGGEIGDAPAEESQRRQSVGNILKEKLNGNRKEISVKDEKIHSLNRRISDMESEMHDLNCTKEKLEAINENIEKENRELKQELLDANRKISDLEVKLKYEGQEKELAESLLSDSHKRTNEMQEKLLKLHQQIVELQIVNERKDEREIVEREMVNTTDQINAGKHVLQLDVGNTVEEVENDSCQKNFTDHEQETNGPNSKKEKQLPSELSKWISLYEITNNRKAELEKEIASLQKEYEELKRSYKETLSELGSAKEDVKSMNNRCNRLVLELEKAVKSKVGLEKQLEEREIKLGLLEDRVGEACLKLAEAQRESRQQNEEKCLATEAVAMMETCANPLLESAEKMLDQNVATTVSEENIPKVKRQERQSKTDEQLVKEIEVLRINNEELIKEIHYLQARETLGQIQKASHKNVIRKLRGNELSREGEYEKMESQGSDLSSIKMAYDISINDILKLSGYLQNYQLNFLEWEDNHVLIQVANERLLSCFSALQALFSELDVSFKELNKSITASDSKSDARVPKSMECKSEITAKQISGQDIEEKMKHKNLENNSSDDNMALKEEICSLKKDNRMLKERNDKLLKTVQELEKQALLGQEEPQAMKVMCTAPNENVTQCEQGIELHEPPRDGREKRKCEPSDAQAISCTDDRYGKADVVCSDNEAISKEDVINKDRVTSKEDVTNKDNVTSKEDVTNKDNVTSKEDVTNKDNVTSKEDVTNKDEVDHKEDNGVNSKDLTSKENMMGMDEVKSKNGDENRSIVEEKVVKEKTKLATEMEMYQLQHQEETDAIDGKPSTRLSDTEENSENIPSLKKRTSTPKQLSEYKTLKLHEGNVLTPQNDAEVRDPKEFYPHVQEIQEVTEKEKWLELELASAKQKVKELESQLQCSTTKLEDGYSEPIMDDKNIESGKSKEKMRMNENANEKNSCKKEMIQIGSTTPNNNGDSESANGDKNVGNRKSKEKKVDENVGGKRSGKKDTIDELQEQNQELKSQVKHYKDYKERVEALISTLRKQVATLQQELEKYRIENMFDFKTCDSERSPIPKEFTVPTRRLFSDEKRTSSPRLRPFQVKYDRTTSVPRNNKSKGWRAMSTPNPDRKMEFQHSVLSEISSLNLAEDFVAQKVEEREYLTADEHQDSSLQQNEKDLEKADGVEKEAKNESSVEVSFCTKDSNDLENVEHEQQGAVNEKQDEDDEKELPRKTTDKKDTNENFILDDKETKLTHDNDLESIGNDLPNIENKDPLLEQQQASRSRDQDVSYRNSSSNPSMLTRSGLGVLPVYIGQMTGRGTYRANMSASRTYPFTRKYY